MPIRPPTMIRRNPFSGPPTIPQAMLVIAFGVVATALTLASVLESRVAAEKLISEELWADAVRWLGGMVESSAQPDTAVVPVGRLLAVLAVLSAAVWVGGGLRVARRNGWAPGDGLAVWGRFGWLWWLLPGTWEGARLATFFAGLDDLRALIVGTPNLLFAFVIAGWAATFFTFCRRDAAPDSTGTMPPDGRLPPALWAAAGAYTVVFGTVSVLIWRNLLVPHGDSAMFEEHLWNLTHGKGFRSYIDGHIFLGEHFQVVHLALLPLYLLWPSHVLLELCQSAALAAGAIPVYRMGARHTRSSRAGLLLACAYLLYTPMQMLDTDIVGKTFRLEAFGLTLLLFALDALDAGRLARTAVFLVSALTSREDLAIVYAPLGVWIAAEVFKKRRDVSETSPTSRRAWLIFGAALVAVSVAYVLFVVKVGIPYFRGGEPHYVSYFGNLGGSLDEVLWNVAANPLLLVRELATAKTLFYAAAVLLPIGFLPLLSPGRLAVGLPLFVTLCLNEVAYGPFHHFHAPLVPVLFWAAAAGLGDLPRIAARRHRSPQRAATWATHFAWTSSLAAGLFFSNGPTGIPFWDPGSEFYWRSMLVRSPRADAFAKVLAAVPPDARVAATDFAHTRFTHHDRSYDYSRFPRAANDGRAGAPPDTDYIVIDVPASSGDPGIERPDQIPEYRDHPDRWELLPDRTDGYFIVLRRCWAPGEREAVRRKQDDGNRRR